MEDADFQDIDDLVPNVDQLEVEKLAIRLTNQLVQFQGCCRDCHEHFNREHANEHKSYCGLQTFVGETKDRELSGCPDILAFNRIASYEDNLAGSMTAAQKRWVFNGIRPNDPEETPIHICLWQGDTPCQTAKVTFDIDSITGFCTSLGIAKGGIRWNFTQMPVSDLQSSLHLTRRRVQFFDSHGHFHSVRKPVNEIPHYMLGRLIRFEDMSLLFLFPNLYREGQQSSRLLDDDFKTWTDQVLLPAIYQHHDSSQLQHYPCSYHHGKYNSTARGVEGRSRKVDALPREQRMMYFVPPDQLHTIWETILETIEQPGLQQFRDVTILLHAKNLKTLTKDCTWKGMMTRLQKYWGDVVDMAHMSADFYVDIGKETCPSQTYLPIQDLAGLPVAETLLWKKCCLDSYYEWSRNGEKTSSCKQWLYPTAMLRDTVSMGLEPAVNSWQRSRGLLYSQFYASMKEVFAAGNQYPFTNTAIETLALDPQLRKTWQHVGAGLSHDPVALMKAYLYAKARCYYGLQGSMQKSFGIREEHRISNALLQVVDSRFRALGLDDQRISLAGDELPFVTYPTSTVLSWCQWNINKFCVGFEMVYSLSQRPWVTWEHTRVMLMFLRCLRYSYGHRHPREAAGCWRDVRYIPNSDIPDGLRRMEGLGFEVTLARYGYAWFLEKMDWETLTFKAPYAQYMLFNNPSMQTAYHARYGQIRDVRADFITVNKIHQLMEEFGAFPSCQEFLEDVLRQICLCAFRKDVFQHIKHLLKKSYVKEALAGKVALCWPSVNRALQRRYGPPHLATGKRLMVQGVEALFAWLWEWKDDHFQRKHWSEKPYRLLYQRSFQIISLIRGKGLAREWKRKLKSTFIRSHWLLPYPQGDRFMKRDSNTKQVCWWSSYHSGVHAYYQGQEELERLEQPLPTSHIKHYPLDGWKLSQNQTQYMPYEVWPEQDLSDLSESEIYEWVSQFAAEGQLALESGIVPNSPPVIYELYSIEPESEASTQEDSGEVGRILRELYNAKEKHQTLWWRQRVRWESEEDRASEGTSDEERLEAREREQGLAVQVKAEELKRAVAEKREEEKRKEKSLKEGMKAGLQQARERLKDIKNRSRLARQLERERAVELRDKMARLAARESRRRIDEHIAKQQREEEQKAWVRRLQGNQGRGGAARLY